ncbi:MAG TPA: hypothetical protein V6C72_01145 [Chroococcales cyanobacterium]
MSVHDMHARTAQESPFLINLLKTTDRSRLSRYSMLALAAGVLLSSHLCQSAGAAAKHHAVRRSSSAPAMPAAPQNPNEMNNLAVSLGQRGLWDQAIQMHERALNADPYNPSFRTNLSAALLGYGKVLLAKGDANKAITKLHYALYVDPNNREAEDVLDGAVKRTGKDPTSSKVREGMRDDYDSNGNYIEAIAEARKVVRMKDDGPSHFALGRVLIKMGSQVQSKQVDGYGELRIAVTKPWAANENNEKAMCFAQIGDMLKDLANIARDNGNTPVALKRLANAGIAFRRAVTTNPLSTDAINGLLEVSREAVALSPTFNNHLMLAGAYQLQPDFERAKREYEACYKLDPRNPALPIARRSFHLSVVSSSQASQPMLANTMQKVEDELRNDPTNAELLYIYGRGKEAQGDREAAVRAYEEAMKINGDVNPNLKPRLAALTGGAPLTASGGGYAGGAAGAPPAQAMAAGKAGSLFGKDLPSAAAGGGQPGQSGQGRPGNTGAPTGTTAGTPPASGSYAGQTKQIAELNAKFGSGQMDEAEKVGTEILDKDPQNAHVWKIMGQIADKKGDLEQASANYRMASGLGDKEADALLNQVRERRVKPIMEDATKAEQSGDYHKALDSLKEASNMAPNQAVIHKKMSDILRHMGDTQEADRELKKAQELEKGGN